MVFPNIIKVKIHGDEIAHYDSSHHSPAKFEGGDLDTFRDWVTSRIKYPKEAIRVVSSSLEWESAIEGEKAVSSKYIIPIVFNASK